MSGRVEGAWSARLGWRRRRARWPGGRSDITESINRPGCNEMALRLRTSIYAPGDSIPSWASGGTGAAPFATPAGSCDAPGPLGGPEGEVTEARYRSAPSFEIWVTWPHMVQVVKYFVPRGMTGMKKSVKNRLLLERACAAGVWQCAHITNMVASLDDFRRKPNKMIIFPTPFRSARGRTKER